MRVNVVIGANYGDEGKGVITDALAYHYPDSIVVMTNGGAQRGHTVISPLKQKPHIFHHFGSGTFRGCMTYFPETFILNPMQFVKEHEELSKDFGLKEIRSIRHPYCIFTTPFDMILNQEIERWRISNGNPYGTCGMGIWETLIRTNFSPIHGFYKYLDQFLQAPREKQVKWLKSIRDNYCPLRFRNATGCEWNPPDYVMSDGLIEHFLDDVISMGRTCPVEDIAYETLASNKNDIIFENGQGLLLDDEYSGEENSVLNTPSRTGMSNVKGILETLNKYFGIMPSSINAYYVTRTYLTRHGPGEVFSAKKGEVFFKDETNGYNEFQGDFRQMPIDHAIQMLRMQKDIDKYLAPIKADKKNATLAFTHVDQMSPEKVDFPMIIECGSAFGAEDIKGIE